MRASTFFTGFIFITLFAGISLGQDRKLEFELRSLVVGAADTLDAREMDRLLSDDFTQAEINDGDNTLLTKKRIVGQLANMPEVLRPYIEHVSTRSNVLKLAAVRSGTTAVFTGSLVARSTLKVSAKSPSRTLTQIERYDISGSAAFIGGEWKLTSLRRTRTAAKDEPTRVAELKANKVFETAVYGLLLEGAARAKATSPADFY